VLKASGFKPQATSSVFLLVPESWSSWRGIRKIPN